MAALRRNRTNCGGGGMMRSSWEKSTSKKSGGVAFGGLICEPGGRGTARDCRRRGLIDSGGERGVASGNAEQRDGSNAGKKRSQRNIYEQARSAKARHDWPVQRFTGSVGGQKYAGFGRNRVLFD